MRTYDLMAYLAQPEETSTAVSVCDFRASDVRRELTLLEEDDHYVIKVSFAPAMTPRRLQRCSIKKRYKFFQNLAPLQHIEAPYHLQSITLWMDEVLSAEEDCQHLLYRGSHPHRCPYLPEGRWQYLLPESHDDWRVRATTTYPRHGAARVSGQRALNLLRLTAPSSLSLDVLVSANGSQTRVRNDFPLPVRANPDHDSTAKLTQQIA